jgi:ribosomal protein S27AE
VLAEAKRIEKARQLLKEYYAGQRMESPNGGFLILLGIRPQEGGTAVGVFECSVSSLRYEILIPKATRTERKKVRDVLQQDGDPDCPRHGPDFRLARAGKNLVCSRCGVAYARV